MKISAVSGLVIALAVATATTRDAASAGSDDDAWVKYAEQANGDMFFYDPSRVEKIDGARRVWNRIRYRTSLMGAFSFLSLAEIDCVSQTEKTLQSTFFSDKNWEQPAMKTNMSESAKREIRKGSAMEQLADILCD